MKIWKRFFDNYYGESVELKYRMFCICASLGTMTSLAGFILCSIIIGVTSLSGISTLFAFLLMLGLTIYGFKTKKIEIAVGIMSIFLNLIVFPLTFFITGGLYSVAPMFFLMGIIIAVPLVSGKKRTILFFAEFIEYSIVIALCYFYPEISFVRDQGVHTTMLLFSFMIVSFYLYTSTWMVVRHFDMERSKSEYLNNELSQQVIRDPLTHLYNRRYLMDFLDNRLLDKKKEFAVAMVDIDDFKYINDTYGHIFGDEVICTLSSIMEKCIHGKGFVARYGGEEFVIYYDSQDLDDFVAIVNNMKDKCKQHFDTEKSLKVSFSAGVVLYENEESIIALLDKADYLLYKAKKDLKDKVCCSK